jgi:hypothetical protein
MQPAPRRAETLLSLVSDLVRRSWLAVDAAHYLDDYEASQWLAPPALLELQRAKLRRLVWHCLLNVPFWSRRLRGAISPADIEQLDGTAPLPVVRADERQPADAFIATSAERTVEESNERRRAVRLRAESWTGVPPQRVVAVWGRDAAVSPRALSPTEIAALRTALRRGARAGVSGPGAALAELAGRVDAHADLVIIRGQEPAPGVERLGGRVVRWLAADPFGVIAAPCERGGLHAQADHLWVESVDGRLVVTDLHAYASPYLRHDLGLRGRVGRACACGRGLPLIDLD